MARQQGEQCALATAQSCDGGRSFDPEPLDHEILDRLKEGARTQAYILDDIDADYSRHQIRDRFKILTAIGAVEKLHDQTALYELNYDPRDDVDTDTETHEENGS